MWRVSDDLWDSWDLLKPQFVHAAKWQGLSGPGHWPDLDMLPLGRISIRGERDADRLSRLTHDEQKTLMTLWAIFRSPLMMGGDLPSLDDFTRSLLTHREVLDVNQGCEESRQFSRNKNQVIWTARIPDSKDFYLAVFNLEDRETHFTLPLDL